MWETWVQYLGWEDPLEKGKASRSSILAQRIPWTVQPGVAKNQTLLGDFQSLTYRWKLAHQGHSNQDQRWVVGWQHSKEVREDKQCVDNSLWLWFLPHGLQEYFLCQVELNVFYLLLGGCQCCRFSGSETLPSLYLLCLHHTAETVWLSTSFSQLPAMTS